MKISWWMVAGVLVLGLAAFFFLSQGSGRYDSFAQCLTGKGAKMYGAFWCSHCAEQKNMFGGSWKHVNYIECSNQDYTQTEACRWAGIEGYPTWEFAGGERRSGTVPLAELARETGCTLPG